MNEEPKSIWKKSFKGRTALVVWLAVAAFTIVLGSFIAASLNYDRPMSNWQSGAGILAGVCLAACLFLIYVVWPLLRWLFWKNWRRAIFLLACFVTLIALFYAEEDWRGWHAWNQFKHQWEAQGEKLDYASAIPSAVPDEQNFALTPVVASCYEMYFDKNGREAEPRNTNVVDRLSILSWRDISYENQRGKMPDFAGWQAAQEVDLKAWQAFFRSPPPTNSPLTNSFPVAPRPQIPADDVLLALSKYDSVIKEIRQASQLPYSRFPLTYDKENCAAILLPHLAALKTSAQAVSLRSVAELQKSRTELAVEDVRLGLYLANAIRTESFLISQVVRLSMVEITLQPIWEGLSEHRWSDAELVAFDEELAKLDFLADYQKTQRSEISFSAKEASFLRRHRDYVTQFAQMGLRYPVDAKFQFAIYRHMPGGRFYQSALKNGRTQMQYMPAVNHDTMTITPALIRRADAAAKNAVSFFDPLDSLRRMFNADFLSSGNFLKKIAYGQASVDLARTAIALERYRLAHGEYPESLDALAPQFMETIPHDVIGGGLLKYRRTDDDQFVLYSVGWNETDDGGVVVMSNGKNPRDESNSSVDINQGDWVWRYPQK